MIHDNLNKEIAEQIEVLQQAEHHCDKLPVETCKKLAASTAKLIDEGHVQKFGNCLRHIEAVYRRASSNIVKLAIENVLLFSLLDHIQLSKYRRQCMLVLPVLMHELMMNQVTKTGL
jgi:hypothetical protein